MKNRFLFSIVFPLSAFKMNDLHRSPRYRALITRYAYILIIVWGLIMTGSLAWNIYNEKQQTIALAVNTARENFNKDLAFRLWGTSHGGVYVAMDDRTRPNPYLTHLDERDLTTTEGKKLTLLNPAYMLNQLMDEYSRLFKIKGKITGLIVQNPKNLPDFWEKKALQSFKQRTDERVETVEQDGETYLRYMKPMFMEPGCVKCHGHLGFKVGDIRGGVSITVPMKRYQTIQTEAIRTMIITHSVIFILGAVGIVLVAEKTRDHVDELVKTQKQMSDLTHTEQNLRRSQQRLVGLLDLTGDAIVSFDNNDTILYINRRAEEVFSIKQEEAVGNGLTDVLPSELLQAKNKYFQALTANTAEQQPALSQYPVWDTAMVTFTVLNNQASPCYAMYLAQNSAISNVPLKEMMQGEKIQALGGVVDSVVRFLALGGPDLIKELRAVEPEPETPELMEERFRETVVEVMKLALHSWQVHTGLGKIELAEQSHVWKVYIDKAGTPRTRTLDKYLKLDNLPKNPRWKDVVQTAHYVLEAHPDENSAENHRLKEALSALLMLTQQKLNRN